MMTKNDLTAIIQKANETVSDAINQYKTENPDADVESILSEQEELGASIGRLSTRELDRFVEYAKKQGTSMRFDAMEMGILDAGRKDMQKGLAEILNSLEFGKQTCPECDTGMENRGHSKKNS